MERKIIVTSALIYANAPVHIGHLVESIQTDVWVRFQKANGNQCLYFCADDTHGTPVMISAKKAGISPEQLIDRVHSQHLSDLKEFHIGFDNYYTTHSPENKQLSELFYSRLNEKGSIVKREVEQSYCPKCDMFLPDRFIRGTCPKCKSENQYGDSCDSCGSIYQSTELINPACATCGAEPVRKTSIHYFFKLADYQNQLKEIVSAGYTGKSVANKLEEWFSAGLRDWDISRDGPYFGFKIPGEENKFFYVWLDAPIGYVASCKNYCDKNELDFENLWNSGDYELYHFIGKDIVYFHALFWPAMLLGADFRVADKLFVHGFLNVNGKKMSKSKGTFIKAATYLKYLDPEFLRYYYAAKLTDGIEDIDLSVDDFVGRTNSELVGKFANLASRSIPMLTGKLDSTLGELDGDGKSLIEDLIAAKDSIVGNYESLKFAAAVRQINALADKSNRYVEQNQPWAMVKTDLEKTRIILTAIINAVRILTIYLKPILPKYAEKVEKILNVENLKFADAEKLLVNHKINKFERLFERIDKKQVEKMIEESKDNCQPAAEIKNEDSIEPIAEECTIDDFAKIDMRIAKVLKAESVEGADKLLRLQLDLGNCQKEVLAGIAKAYKPDELVGKIVICLANLKPRKMKFGVSEGMILAAGPGGEDIFVLSADSGVKPGQRVG